MHFILPKIWRALLFISSWALTAHAEDSVPGVSRSSIVFGQSAAYSGSTGDLGKELRIGIEAAFNESNMNGGVHGRHVYLIYYDDRLEPDRAIVNTRRLINKDKVFALIGSFGTPTSISAAPVASSAGVPYVAPVTGAEQLRRVDQENVINLRASFTQEIEAIVELLVDELGIENIAVLYQDDSLGRDGYSGARKALAARKLQPVASGVYPRNTIAIKSAFYDLRKADPEAIILVGNNKPIATFILWARFLEFEPVFATISISGNNSLTREIGTAGDGVYATQVVPDYMSETLPAAVQYRAALDALWAGTPYGFFSFEGYLAGRLAIEALERCGPEVDRVCFQASMLSSEEFDIGGFKLRFGEADNQGSDSVYLTRINADGKFDYENEFEEVSQ
ncbi:MAG: ABC transporter substrate-binding protein [Albidovulum sp.]|nr:ABC transporter substrate-binding protein [Albidovulum sp.]MDE0531326.1 ABC transporter substrate-binding protein [Albidovulum sp.]